MRAPVTHRALSGALRQDEKGRISKSKENKEFEHVGDESRYVFAREVRTSDIVRDCMAPAPPTAVPALGAEAKRQEIIAAVIEQGKQTLARAVAIDAATSAFGGTPLTLTGFSFELTIQNSRHVVHHMGTLNPDNYAKLIANVLEIAPNDYDLTTDEADVSGVLDDQISIASEYIAQCEAIRNEL
jgi:hypothetical protein